MIADELIAQEIKKLGLEPIIQKHHLVPKFETWVSIKGVPRLEIDYTAYADCGVKFYIEGSDVCVGMIQHFKNHNGLLRVSSWIKDNSGNKVLSDMPWQMYTCVDTDDFDRKVGALIEQRRQDLVEHGQFRLFMVKLSDDGYDSYDSAVIACVDKATLEEICKSKFNRYRQYNDYDIIFDQSFNIHECQRVESITEIGVYSGEMYRDTKAKVICSSYNAG
jgi:hypothetical protein